MKDDDAIPLEPVTDEATEARIVAWVLGEASAFEITELERLCAEKPELEIFRRRMLALQGLLKDSASEADDAEWKLSSEKRERVLETIGADVAEDAAQEKRVSRMGLRVMLGIAACVVVTLVVMRLVSPHAQRKYAVASSSEVREVAFVPAAGGGSMDELQRKVREQEARVEEKRKELSSVVRQKGIIYRGDDTFGPQDQVAMQEARGVLKREKASVDGQIERLREYDGEQLMTYASGLDLPENAVKTLYPQYLESRRELDEAKNKGLGESHPEVQKLAQQTENLKKDLDAGAESLRATLEAQSRLTDARLAKVDSLKGAKKDESIQRGADATGYVAAKQEFESELAKLNEMKRQVAGDPTLASRARPRTVTPATPSVTSASAMRDAEVADRSTSVAGEEMEDLYPQARIPRGAAVRRSLYKAEGDFNLGKYDDAKKAYEETLKVDPHNDAARRGLERVASARSDYYRSAYDHTRAELLGQVEKPAEVPASAPAQAPGTGDAFGRAESDLAAVPKKKANVAENAPMDGFKAAPTADSAPNAGDVLSRLTDSIEITDESNAIPAAGARGGYLVPEPRPDYKMEGDFLSGDLAAKDAGIMTEGLRSGDQAVTRNNIDALLNHPDRMGADQQVPGFLGKAEGTAAYEFAMPDAPAAPAGAPDPFVADADVAKLEILDEEQASKQMEEKSKLAPNEPPAFDAEIIAAEEPFSTFSLNVSDVSFQLARAALERGEQPAPESIKVEQFYNAVDYGDAAPSSGEPVAGVVEQSAHPVIPGRNLVRMGVRTAAAGRSAAQPLRLTLLVDQSGSMVREDRKAAMEKAVAGLGQLLTEADRISVIGFSRTSRLIVENLPGNKIAELGALVNPEASEGGTNLEEALRLSEVIANRHKLDGAQNRVVLFTDGAANLGDADPARLAEKVKAMRQAGIAFDVAGIGAEDLNDRLLAELARNGNGRYYVAADNLAAQLAGAFRPAAEDVKVQVKFNPQRVKGYRLIGFEESRLKTEDFRNDAIDAAELAAEEAAVALYQVEVLPGGTGEIGEMSVRFREAGTGNTVERSWTIPYDAATPAFDKATPSMKLAGLSMLAAEKLKGGPLADATNLRELVKPLADAKQYYKDSRKVADMARVIELLAK